MDLWGDTSHEPEQMAKKCMVEIVKILYHQEITTNQAGISLHTSEKIW